MGSTTLVAAKAEVEAEMLSVEVVDMFRESTGIFGLVADRLGKHRELILKVFGQKH